MSYQEKRTITSLVAGALLLGAYCIYAFGGNGPGAAGELKAWAVTMLVFIGIGVGVSIVLQILFHIAMSVSIAVREKGCDEKKIDKTIKAEMVEDERDKLIELKSSKAGFAIVGTGFVAALAVLALGGSAALMLNIVFLSMGAGALLGGFISLYYYRKGVKNA